ncbi:MULTISPECIES: hypothetical protein [Streptomyces]|uniref:Uncharacterized protein n=1 Tax=Streptomyces griseocarneus TaxID=51201 RepID=A0ABX7RRR2_9ACTN|nr:MULTISPECIES: hypothetical protein [Streptomyces]QSY50188.1 hypothetical protein J3S04_03800 [Streptomyces griseocarneus]
MATHMPADHYTRGGPHVIPPPPARQVRPYMGPLAFALAFAFALMGLAAAAMALFEFAIRTAAVIGSLSGPIGVGITLKLFHSKAK